MKKLKTPMQQVGKNVFRSPIIADESEVDDLGFYQVIGNYIFQKPRCMVLNYAELLTDKFFFYYAEWEA